MLPATMPGQFIKQHACSLFAVAANEPEYTEKKKRKIFGTLAEQCAQLHHYNFDFTLEDSEKE